MDPRHWLSRFLGAVAAVFLEIERSGDPLPSGPVLVVANHPNSLLDPLVIFRTAGRPTRPLAKAPLFQKLGVGLILRILRGLPVYRRQDDPSLVARNDATFSAAATALRAGEAVQIYPEGLSHSEPSLQPIRTGAARLAFEAEASADWGLGLVIVPVGLTYSEKSVFRGRVVAETGTPLRVADFRDRYDDNPAAAVRTLTARIARALEAVTLNVAQREDRELIETAERIFAREKGLARWRDRESLRDRLPRLRAFATALAWLRAHDPDRHARLERAVRRHQRRLALLGAGDADVPPRYAPGNVVVHIVRRGVWVALGLPLGLLGTILWAPPYFTTRFAMTRLDLKEDVIATYKLAAALVLFPIAYAGWAILAWWLGGAPWLIATLVILPPLGLIAIHWRIRWERLAEDARLFLRLFRQPARIDRIAEDRRTLVAEFDDIWADVQQARETGWQPIPR
jgi:glycerol-3-phosphate O-acyltransferase / dihydroxyacetone phosphate acyltransferase